MTSRAEKTVVVDQADPNRGRIDVTRLGRKHPDDTEERPVVTPEDIEATRRELEQLRSGMVRKTA